MTLTPLAISLISVMGGALIALLVKHLELFGRTVLIHKKVDVHYRQIGEYQFLIWIILHAQLKTPPGKNA